MTTSEKDSVSLRTLNILSSQRGRYEPVSQCPAHIWSKFAEAHAYMIVCVSETPHPGMFAERVQLETQSLQC